MSDLTRFRDHCRAMARTGEVIEHRSLWVLLADEVDAYLVGQVESTDLWGDVAVEAAVVRDG